MHWCGSGGDVWFDNYGPSECLCYSTAVLVPSVFLIFYLILKYVYNIILKVDQEFYASSSRRLLHTTMGLFFLNPVLFSVVAFVGSDSGSNIFPAKVIGVSVNILAWVMCVFSVYYDFHCRLPWPCAGIRYFLCFEVLSHAVTISSIYSSQRNNFKLILGSVSFLITVTLLVIALFKERFSLLCDRARFKFSDEKFFSEDHFSETADSFTSANINVSFQDSNRSSRSMNPFRGFFSFSDGNTTSVDTEAEEGLLGRASDLSDASSYYTGHYRDSSCDRLSLGGPPLSGRAHGHEEQSLVQSIMDKNLQPPPPTQHLQEGAGGAGGGGAVSSTQSSPTKSQSGLEDGPGSFSVPALSPSSALARVLRTSSHRSALALSNSSSSSSGMLGGLAPRGQVPRQQHTAGGAGMGMRAKDIQSSNSSDNSDPAGGGAAKQLEDLQIRMGKYGFRRENSPFYGHSGVNSGAAVGESSGLNEGSGDDKQFPTRLSSFDKMDEVGPGGSVNRPKVLREDTVGYENFNTGGAKDKDKDKDNGTKEVDLVNMSPVSNLLMEVEFEILFRLPAAEGEKDGGEKDGGEKGGGGEGMEWSCWRTGKELMSLHAVMVGRLGDLAPRRPKMSDTTLGPQPDTSTISRESILTDTRVMGGYLRALVSQSLFHVPEFCVFCDLPLALVPPPVAKPESHTDNSTTPTATTLSRETSATADKDSKDQWRRIFLNLRKNLKPKELAARCRVYDGVVCGKDITKWLLTSTYKYALDYTEAHRIAQGLLEADLLTPVCAGYDHTLQLTPRDSGISRSTAAGGETAAGAGAVSCSQNIVTDRETLATFKSHPSYIYRYPGRSGPSGGIGAFSMFAHRVVTSIPSWFQADAEDTSASSITNYTVRSCLLDEQWEVFRRFNEFSQFHKNLQKEGIKPAEAFPTTSFSMLLLGVTASSSSSAEAKLKERAVALELYLSSAIEAIMLAVRDLPGDSYSDMDIYSDASPPHQRHRILTLLATFLDDEHLHLRLCCPSAPSTAAASAASSAGASQDQQVISLDEHVDSLVL